MTSASTPVSSRTSRMGRVGAAPLVRPGRHYRPARGRERRRRAARRGRPVTGDSAGIARMVYSFGDRVLAITTPDGESAVMQIESSADAAQDDDQPVVLAMLGAATYITGQPDPSRRGPPVLQRKPKSARALAVGRGRRLTTVRTQEGWP
jgi:hypothetical protein